MHQEHLILPKQHIRRKLRNQTVILILPLRCLKFKVQTSYDYRRYQNNMLSQKQNFHPENLGNGEKRWSLSGEMWLSTASYLKSFMGKVSKIQMTAVLFLPVEKTQMQVWACPCNLASNLETC